MALKRNKRKASSKNKTATVGLSAAVDTAAPFNDSFVLARGRQSLREDLRKEIDRITRDYANSIVATLTDSARIDVARGKHAKDVKRIVDVLQAIEAFISAVEQRRSDFAVMGLDYDDRGHLIAPNRQTGAIVKGYC